MVETRLIVVCPRCGVRWDVTDLPADVPIRCDCRALLAPQPNGGLSWFWVNNPYDGDSDE